jgi:hypothetical protein
MERAELLKQLLSSFDLNPSVTADIETAWLSEARERMVAYQNGEISARSADEVFWEELCQDTASVPSPAWHAANLNEREAAVEQKSEHIVDWEEAKRRIRESLASDDTI